MREYASAGGYQQTRAMMCIASGGLFGLGAGNGWLKYVFAADTDLVFAFLCEEWGPDHRPMRRCGHRDPCGVYRPLGQGRPQQLLYHCCLRRRGDPDHPDHSERVRHDGPAPADRRDVPFLSNGGSSMLASWGLIAFLKAADTRQNASFAVRTAKAEEVEPLE